MAELRWVLLGLGVLVVAGVYLWGRGVFRRGRFERSAARRRAEPHISEPPQFADDDRLTAPSLEDMVVAPAETAGEPAEPAAAPSPAGAFEQHSKALEEHPSAPEKVITIRFIPRAGEIGGEEAVQALREAGLEHGRYGIFHLHGDGASRDAQFSVASLTEPGSFDLTQLAKSPIAGMSFFMVLPGTGDPVTRFDAMVQAARMLAIELDAELFDDRGSSWSIQRERYVREEIIRYRHQLMQTEVVGNARA